MYQKKLLSLQPDILQKAGVVEVLTVLCQTKRAVKNSNEFFTASIDVFGDRKIRCRINELNRSKRACEGDPKACEGTSRGEVRLELIG